MLASILSRMIGRGRASSSSTLRRRRRSSQRLADASGQAIQALEGRVLLSVLYVDVNAPGPTRNGLSWTTAYRDLQQALSVSTAGTEIRIADGTYRPTSTIDRTISFALRDGVAIRGGYAGHGAADPDARDIALYPTILSGNIGATGSALDNSLHVVTASGVSASTVLDGVTITEGNANGTQNWSCGGGLYATSNASPTVINCTFSGNSATDGGGVYNWSSSPTLINCTFSGNSVSGSSVRGGGMYNRSSSPTLINCTFRGNSVSGFDAYGGGMYNIFSSAPRLTNCTFSGNSAIGSISYGGGMFNTSSSSPTLINCTFSGGNRAHLGGGMYNGDYSSPTLTNCTFSGNWAFGADGNGAGVYNSSSSPVLTNCIFWGHIGSAFANSNSFNKPIITYSNIEGGYAGIGNISTDPMFVRVPWPGPDGVFGTADDDPGDLRLRPGSPMLDIGSNAAIPAGIDTDLAGNVRIQGGTVDMGAYEGTTTPPAPRTFYVDAAATGGSNTGVSWANAFTSLQSALTATGIGDIIRVAQGTYRPTTGTDRTISFLLRDGAALYGGYAGISAADPDARDVSLYPTILSGDIGIAGSSADNSYHVVTAMWVGSATVLNGVRVLGGNANGPGINQSTGGGFLAIRSSPALASCIFSGNWASGTTGSGGGMSNWFSSPTLINCSFSGNSAALGGGMFNNRSSPTLTNSTFSGNAAGEPYGHGGGMYNSYSFPRLANCIIWGNTTGTVVNDAVSTPVITYSNIEGGYAGIGNISTDPMFVRVPWPGPDGVFGTADDDPGDLRLRPGSPMLDIGSNAAIPAGIDTDLAGNVRIQGGTVDMGAYEGTTTPPAPRTFYVDAAATGGSNTGVSWANAFTSLQSALTATGIGDIIRVAQGTYRPTDSTNRTISFVLRDGVTIHGGYAGQGAADPGARNVLFYPTVLSGDIGQAGNSADNSYHVVTAIRVGSATILDGVTVTLGNANGSGINQSYGGGVFAFRSSPVLVNCIFSGNSASGTNGYGGAIYNFYSSPTVANCDFVGNSASGTTVHGGGMYNNFSSPTLINCTFTGNSARWGSGGAMYNSSSSPTLINCTFNGNSADFNGGGMLNSLSSPTLINSTFSGNSAAGSYGRGGGMYNSSSSPALTNCTFSGNSAGTSTSASGGGMYNSSSSPALINCTFSGNSTGGSGGGIYNISSSSPTLINCILWGNAAGEGPQLLQSASTPVIAYSLIQGGYEGTGNINADPLFVRNPSPGPDGKWGTADDDYGDLRLRPESPCVDRGNNNATGLAGITTDLAGRPRFVDVALTPDAGLGTPPIIDMGAYEVQWRAPAWLDPAGLAAWDFNTYSLDIGQNTLTIAADDSNRQDRLAAVRQFIAAGRAGGAGIVSGAAGEERWVVVTLDAEGSIVVRLALIGDVTLDDRVDGDDYFALDQAYLFSGGFTLAADLNLDGRIDGGDYFVLDRAFVRATVGGVLGSAGMAGGQVARESAGNVFSTRSIAEELLLEEDTVLRVA